MSVKVYYTDTENKEAYYNAPLLNQSFLKTLIPGKEYREDKKEETGEILPLQEILRSYREPKNLMLGDYLDTYLTSGNPKEVLNQKYYVEPIEKKPSESVMNIIKLYYTEISGVDLSMKGPLISIARSLEYRNNYSDDKLYEMLVKEGLLYFQHLQKAEGKVILSQEDFDLITEMLEKVDKSEYKIWLLETPWRFFGLESSSPELYYEVHFQKEIYFTIPDWFLPGMEEPLECKALLDILILEKSLETGEVVRAHVIDLKTTGTALFRFNEAVNKFRYDFQLAFYSLAAAIEFNLDILKVSQGFLVISKVNRDLPMIYARMSAELLNRGLFGETTGNLNLITDFRKTEHRFPYLGVTAALKNFQEEEKSNSNFLTRYLLTSSGFMSP